MGKRLAALLFCLALLFQAMIPSAYALRSIYFTAAGNEVLPLEDGKMPLWYNGYLYLPSTIFTGRVNRSLDVAYLPNTAAGVLRVRGERLTLMAMTAGELRIGGKIASIEWVGSC